MDRWPRLRWPAEPFLGRASLGTRLAVSFAAIILFSLSLAGLVFVYLLQPFQTQQALARLGNLALPLAAQVRILEMQGTSVTDMASFLNEQARDIDARALLVRRSDGLVLHDTGDTLKGSRLQVEGAPPLSTSPIVEGTAEVPGEGSLSIVAVRWWPRPPQGDRLRLRLNSEPFQVTVALAAPQSSLASEWLQMLPRLGAATGLSLVVSAALAGMIARSISHPLADITRASEAMAEGDYAQRIQVTGGDEVARLSTAFNAMAEQVNKSNRTLRAFLADVSHELRTPLTTIKGFSEAILDGTASQPEEVEEAARIIRQDAARMERMVEDLLYLSKIESGQLEMELEQTDLAGIVEGAAKRARRRAEGRQVRIEATAVPIEVTVDPHRIEQVLDNLLSNALTHTPNGGQVTITGLRDNGTVRIRVHNTGSFIPEEDRHRIFERFARASTNGSGTGLGLAIAAEIARHHGGGIELDTSETEGTAFTLVIPVHRPVAV